MFNLSEMLAGAQGGKVLEALARQYKLTPEQADAAVEALLPAFSIAFKRMAATPEGLAQLLGMMAQANYHAYYENAAAAFTPPGLQAGNDALSKMFGSSELNQAIADQAAQFAGVGSPMLQKIMPAMAAMLMGGLDHAMAAGRTGAEMYQQALEGVTGRPPGRSAPDPTAAVTAFWASIVNSMTGGRPGATAPAPASEQPPATPAAPPDADQPSDFGSTLEQASRQNQRMLEHLFATGRDIQQAQFDHIQRVFDAFFDKGQRR